MSWIVKARAQLHREEREIHTAHQRGLLAQQADFVADFAGA